MPAGAFTEEYQTFFARFKERVRQNFESALIKR
jgi:hypothetical protein